MIRFVFGNDFGKFLLSEVRKRPLAKDAEVLNIACEYDLIPSFLRRELTEKQAYGIEINQDIVKTNSHIRYCDVNTDPFPFKDKRFDLVISIFGIEHFQTPNVFRESYRVLKPGGRMMFIVPNALYPMFLINRLFGERFARFYYRTIVKSTYAPHKAYYRFNSISAITKASANAGFESTNLTMFGPSNVLLYVKRSALATKIVSGFDRLLTNAFLCRFKPYIIGVLERKE